MHNISTHCTRRALTVLLGAAGVGGLFFGQSDAWAQGAPTGTFTVNGKPAALTQVTAHKGEPERGQPVTVLVFTTKSQGGDAKAAFNALFNNFGNAVVAKVFEDGKVYSVDLVHTALDSPTGSLQVFGTVTMKDFSTAGGTISGRLTSGGPQTARNDKWDLDLTFKVKAP
jgi:hypothetical protein